MKNSFWCNPAAYYELIYIIFFAIIISRTLFSGGYIPPPPKNKLSMPMASRVQENKIGLSSELSPDWLLKVLTLTLHYKLDLAEKNLIKMLFRA